MPTIMCTRNLWSAVGGHGRLPARQTASAEAGRLHAWSARELAITDTALVVGIEEATYLTVVCPLLQLPDFSRAFAASAAAALQAIGIAPATCEREAWAIIEEARFAKNDNRSLLGSLNDVAFHVSVRLENERRISLAALERVQNELNRMPHVGRATAFPHQAVRLLFAPAVST
jgi:uncharacterized protein DUF6933